jgi:hypothetical protein
MAFSRLVNGLQTASERPSRLRFCPAGLVPAQEKALKVLID